MSYPLHLRVKRRGRSHRLRLGQAMAPLREINQLPYEPVEAYADPRGIIGNGLSPMALADNYAARDRAQVYRMDVPHNLPVNGSVNEPVNEPPPGCLKCMCGKTVKLRADGRLRAHGVGGRDSAECLGSDRTPAGLLFLSIGLSMNSPQGMKGGGGQ